MSKETPDAYVQLAVRATSPLNDILLEVYFNQVPPNIPTREDRKDQGLLQCNPTAEATTLLQHTEPQQAGERWQPSSNGSQELHDVRLEHVTTPVKVGSLTTLHINGPSLIRDWEHSGRPTGQSRLLSEADDRLLPQDQVHVLRCDPSQSPQVIRYSRKPGIAGQTHPVKFTVMLLGGVEQTQTLARISISLDV